MLPQWRPRRAVSWELDDEGRAILLRPRLGRGAVASKIQAWLGLDHTRIRLDEIGTAVWKSLDGETPLTRVLDLMRRQFGEKVEPAEELLLQFIRQMERARLIDL